MPIGKNVSVPMNNDFDISIISTIGDIKKEYKLSDVMKENASLLPLSYYHVSILHCIMHF